MNLRLAEKSPGRGALAQQKQSKNAKISKCSSIKGPKKKDL